MNLPSILLTALIWAAAAGAAVWLVTLPLQRRSLAGLLAAVVLTGTIAAAAAVVGNVRAMFISTNELAAVAAVSIVAGLVASVTAGLAARRLTRDNRALRDAVVALGQGRPPTARRPLTTQLEQLHADLEMTARRLSESRHREQALERSRRELIAWISHDLRTPLAGLRAMAEALEDGMVEQPEHYYKQIHAQVDRLTGMVDDLFDLSRIQAGGFGLDTEMVAVDDLVSDCVAALEPLALAAGVRLRGRCDAPVTVTGTVAELDRAVTNLVANAIQHTPTGGSVAVIVRRIAGRAEILVRDGCGGIPADAVDRVFDMGYRHEPARTPRVGASGGAGLGLAITRGIATAHDGTVDVDNVPGGCQFRLRLPAAG